MNDDDLLAKNIPGFLDQIPPELLVEALERRQVNGVSEPRQSVVVKAQAQFSGPIPPPHLVQRYEAIQPGSADRILSMAEADLSNSHLVEQSALKGAIQVEKRGQIFAFSICMTSILGAIGLIALDHDIAGVLLVGTTLLGLASIFITGKRDEKTNQDDDP